MKSLMKFKMLGAGAVIALGGALLGISGANATTVLTYTGAPLTTIGCGTIAPICGTDGPVYSGRDIVTATFVLSNPLGSNFGFQGVVPLSFSISDGVATYSGPTFNFYLFIGTNSVGTIDDWRFQVVDFTTSNLVYSQSFCYLRCDYAQNGGSYEQNMTPGMWRITTTDVTPPPVAANLGGPVAPPTPGDPNSGCTGSNSSPIPMCMEANPINAATGNKFQVEKDFAGGVNTGLALTRYYNSQDTTSSAFGKGWHSTGADQGR